MSLAITENMEASFYLKRQNPALRAGPCLAKWDTRRETRTPRQWKREDLNLQPPHCKSGALPLELRSRITSREGVRESNPLLAFISDLTIASNVPLIADGEGLFPPCRLTFPFQRLAIDSPALTCTLSRLDGGENCLPLRVNPARVVRHCEIAGRVCTCSRPITRRGISRRTVPA